MGDSRNSDHHYIEPRAISTMLDGVTYEGTLYISWVGRDRYQYPPVAL